MNSLILIVDDSEDQIELMRIVFHMVNKDVKVEGCLSGTEALARLRSEPLLKPAVILMDLKMPGKDGIAVLKEIKADPKLRTIPVCMFSNGEIQKDVCESYSEGASLYFKKPVGLEELKIFSEHFCSLWLKYASHCEI